MILNEEMYYKVKSMPELEVKKKERTHRWEQSEILKVRTLVEKKVFNEYIRIQIVLSFLDNLGWPRAGAAQEPCCWRRQHRGKSQLLVLGHDHEEEPDGRKGSRGVEPGTDAQGNRKII
ncbi:Potassium Voltage-Gated Channel Subfamily C Member 4 [Manis pentadactyla]|nr:Potassium Voltage-Gated Channel Subfamily C Member 4 [Manis pentadactyla]